MKIVARLSLVVVIQSETLSDVIVRVAQKNCRLYSALCQASFTWTSRTNWRFLNRRPIPRHSHLRNGSFLYRQTPLLFFLNRLRCFLPQIASPLFHSLVTFRYNLLLSNFDVGGWTLNIPILIFRSNRILSNLIDTFTTVLGFIHFPIFSI